MQTIRCKHLSPTLSVIHHQVKRFLDAARRDVAAPVDPFEPGSGAEMEARDRIDGVGLRQVVRAEAQQGGAFGPNRRAGVVERLKLGIVLGRRAPRAGG